MIRNVIMLVALPSACFKCCLYRTAVICEHRVKQNGIYLCVHRVSVLRSVNFPHVRREVLSSTLLSKNIKIKIYRTIILPVVLYGCET